MSILQDLKSDLGDRAAKGFERMMDRDDRPSDLIAVSIRTIRTVQGKTEANLWVSAVLRDAGNENQENINSFSLILKVQDLEVARDDNHDDLFDAVIMGEPERAGVGVAWAIRSRGDATPRLEIRNAYISATSITIWLLERLREGV